MVLISPWLDVTMTNPTPIATIDDPVLRLTSMRKAGQQWAGDLSPNNPLISPICGSLAGLPPTAVYSGNLDLLATDVLRLKELALATGASDFTFIVRNGAIHDWAMGGALSTPEGASVQRHLPTVGIGCAPTRAKCWRRPSTPTSTTCPTFPSPRRRMTWLGAALGDPGVAPRPGLLRWP
jgi:acetyl esterase/lipase